jgi:hypothetical protein
MVNFSKKLLLLFACLCITPVAIAKKIKKTKKLQLLIVPNDPSFIFALNTGTGITTDPGASRPQGSYYEISALIFPGGTIGKNQTDYSVDKHGNPIDLNDNIGIAYFLETMIQALDFSGPLPPMGTMIEQSEWRLNFKDSCNGTNNIYTMGLAKVGHLPPQTGKEVYNLSGGVTGGSGCNRTIDKNSFKAKIYIPQTGSAVVALVNVEFHDDIQYKD